MEINLINEIVTTYAEYTDAPLDFLEIAAYSTIATVAGNNVYCPYNTDLLYPNLWCILLAPSSTYRKSTVVNISKKLVSNINPSRIFPDEFSHEAVIDHLSINACGCFYFSEFASLTGLLSTSYNMPLKSFLTNMYDCPTIPYNRNTKTETKSINNPAISIFSGTTLNWFLSKGIEKDIAGGFIPRFLIVPAFKKEKSIALSEKNIANLNLVRIFQQLKLIAKKKGPFYLDFEAKKRYTDWYLVFEKTLNTRNRYAPFLARFPQILIKIAMLHNLATDKTLVIGENCMGEAIKLIEKIKTNIIKIVAEEIFFSETEKLRNNIMRILDSGEISHSKLLKSCNCDKLKFKLGIETLIESNLVIEKQTNAPFKPGKIYAKNTQID